MNLLAGPQWRCRHRKQTCGHSGGRRKRKGRIESGIEAYTLPYVKYIASGNLLYDAWSSNLILCDNLQAWDGVGKKFKREGTYVYLWLTHIDIWQKPTQHCNQLSSN